MLGTAVSHLVIGVERQDFLAGLSFLLGVQAWLIAILDFTSVGPLWSAFLPLDNNKTELLAVPGLEAFEELEVGKIKLPKQWEIIE